jgi:hypothetical protein
MMSMGKVKVERRQRLLDICKHVVDNPHDVDGDTKAALKRATLKYASTLHDDPTQALEVLYYDQNEIGRLLRKAVEVIADHDDASDDQAPVSDHHHASTIANLLVEAGSHPNRSAALHHLLHSARGQALLSRMNKKDEPMDTIYSIMKSAGVGATCAAIVAKGTTTITQDAIVDAVSKVAHERWPELTEAQAFDKIYSDSGGEGRVLRQAIDVAKAAVFEVAGLPVQVVGGADARDVDDPSAAIAALHELGRKLYPQLTEAQAFDKVFTDPKHAALAAKAHRRPSPYAHGAYPHPR